MLMRYIAPFAALAGFASAYDVWCGKTYKATDPAIDPGGWLNAPKESKDTLIDIRFRSRMSVYVEGDPHGSFLVGANLTNRTIGKEWYFDAGWLNISISLSTNNGTDRSTALALGNLTVNSDLELNFTLADKTPRNEPYSVTLTAVAKSANNETTTEYIYHGQFYYLPEQKSTASVARLDTLTGGLWVQDGRDYPVVWKPLFPYSYYVNWGGWLEESLSNLDHYAGLGYNMIHMVPDGGATPFNVTTLNTYLDRIEQLGLWVMYDMRWTYMNQSLVTQQVNMLKDRKSLLLWYTGDEPDGQVDPQDATLKTYDLIRTLDPYHPISLCLNCYNYYYEAYSSGADILLSDVYPVGINATYSTVWNTTCNTTYGDCGCDDCEGKWEDISIRLDRFAMYDDWLGRSTPKTLWGVPQAFGEESYWPRYPTADEEVMMNVLSINHNAKAIVMWDFPTHDDIANTTGSLSKLLTTANITDYLTNSLATPLKTSGVDRVDAATWLSSDNKTRLVSVVYLGDEATNGSLTIQHQGNHWLLGSTPWGGGGWTKDGDGNLFKTGLKAHQVSLILLH